MSGLDDQGFAAAVGAFFAGAVAAGVEVFRRRKRKDAPELIEDHASAPLASRVGRLYEHVTLLEQEIRMLKQNVDIKLDKLDESIEELRISRAKTDELLPLIREQMRELREDLRDDRRRATTHKE